ncbi:unnamed protein product, partial [Allacma fusca]
SIPIFYIHLILKRSNDPGPSDKMFLAIVLPFAALVQESRSIPRRARLFTVITIFYALIVGQFYCSNLISFLTFPEPEVIPRSFEELSNRKDYTIYTMYYKGSALDIFFNQTKAEAFVQIRKRMINEPNFFKCPEHALLKQKTACISLLLIVEPFLAKNLTLHSSFNPLKISPPAFSIPVNIGLQKNSKHFESMNSIVGWALDTGQFLNWKQLTLDHLKRRGIVWMRNQRGSEIYKQLH